MDFFFKQVSVFIFLLIVCLFETAGHARTYTGKVLKFLSFYAMAPTNSPTKATTKCYLAHKRVKNINNSPLHTTSHLSWSQPLFQHWPLTRIKEHTVYECILIRSLFHISSCFCNHSHCLNNSGNCGIKDFLYDTNNT